MQQLYLPAGQDEVTVNLLWAPSSPLHATLNSSSAATKLIFPSMLHFGGLEDIRGGIPETSSSSADTHASSGTAPVTAQETVGFQGCRGREGRVRQQVQLTRTLGTTGVVVTVCGQEDLGGSFLIRQSGKICRTQAEPYTW